ncbi:ATP-dependent DNA ligase [Rhodococcus sp. C-2]|uniref:ATP-dependent DNA ligase n=1 Tax=Rhodococcus sp. C-2 TaxID=3018809 RepID=UPI0022EB3490|nr:hypothetical protein [Rhodococcus sp. C-2]MDA3637675.1 hypothetical protein [Rhodococcus sp. C-2]
MSATAGKPVPPMLATLGQPPTGERWAFESKWDGQRDIATTDSKAPALWSRNGNVIVASFPEIVDALSAVLDHRETVLDGGIVALGPGGVPSFSLFAAPDARPADHRAASQRGSDLSFCVRHPRRRRLIDHRVALPRKASYAAP